MKIGTEGTFVFNKNHGFITTASQKESNLFRTRCYLVGHMQYADGRDWRDYVSTEMEAMGITVFNPYDKDMDNGHYNDVAKRMKQIRSYDLNLVDRSDFIIAHLLPEVASWGSAEELVTAVRMKKPVFVSMEGGKKKTPLWVMGMMPHHYIYDSVEDIVDMLKRINSGDKEIDSDRWRLLRKELR